jgi:hypothetical protein
MREHVTAAYRAIQFVPEEEEEVEIEFVDDYCTCEHYQLHAIFEAAAFLYTSPSQRNVDIKRFASWMIHFLKTARQQDSVQKKSWAQCQKTDCGEWHILPKGLCGDIPAQDLFTCTMMGIRCRSRNKIAAEIKLLKEQAEQMKFEREVMMLDRYHELVQDGWSHERIFRAFPNMAVFFPLDISGSYQEVASHRQR